MGAASRVMYSIANFFTWIVVLCCIAGIIFFPLTMAGVIANYTSVPTGSLGGYLAYLIVTLIFSLIAISMVRIAKARGTSKAWDILFIILGVLSANPFYVLGGIFGLFALS